MSLNIALPRNEQGRFYHIDCGPGDLAPYILACGDPDRAGRLARHFDAVAVRRRHREFVAITGTYRGIPVSAMATGIGPDNTAIAVIEASQCVSPATFIRLGTTGALQEHIAVGDLVITAEAIRDETTSHYYAAPDLPATAHPAVIQALQQAAAELKVPYHMGVTCTTADFYAGQGRSAPGFPCRDPGKVASLQAAGVLNMEMEMSAYLTLVRISSYPLRAGGACVVLDNLVTGGETFASVRGKQAAVRRLLRVGLRAVEILADTDKRNSPQRIL